MKDKVLLSIKLRTQLSDEQGQDLIEYALMAALIAFGSTATMTTLSSDIGSVFTTVGVTLNNAVS